MNTARNHWDYRLPSGIGFIVWLTKTLSLTTRQNSNSMRYEKSIIIAFLFVLYNLPVFNWILNGRATSTLDKFSYFFASLALLLLALQFCKNKRSSQPSIKVLNLLTAFYLIIEIATVLLDINIMCSTNLIYFACIIIYAKFGKQQTITALPYSSFFSSAFLQSVS